MEKKIPKTVSKSQIKSFPDKFVLVDRICPFCCYPISVKETPFGTYLMCTNPECSFIKREK